MAGLKYVIYLWRTRTLGDITCARAFVDDCQMELFIEKINKIDDFEFLDIAERTEGGK